MAVQSTILNEFSFGKSFCVDPISLKFVAKGPNSNNPKSVQIMDLSQSNRQQDIIWVNDGLFYRRIYVSLDLNHLIERHRNVNDYRYWYFNTLAICKSIETDKIKNILFVYAWF